MRKNKNKVNNLTNREATSSSSASVKQSTLQQATLKQQRQQSPQQKKQKQQQRQSQQQIELQRQQEKFKRAQRSLVRVFYFHQSSKRGANKANEIMAQPQQQPPQLSKKALKAVAAKKPIPEEYNRLPNLVPVQSAYYTFLPAVKNEVNNLHHYSVYHLWLDCLYKHDVSFDQIIDGLKPVLDSQAKRKSIKIRNIFILGHRFDDGSFKPGGSCYLMLDDCVRGRARNRDFELDIVESKVHMSRIETTVLLRQLNTSPTLLLTAGFKDQLAQFPIEDLLKVCKIKSAILAPIGTPPAGDLQQQPQQQCNKQPVNKPTANKPSESQLQQINQPSKTSQQPVDHASNYASSSKQSPEIIGRLLQQRHIATQQSLFDGLSKLQNGLSSLTINGNGSMLVGNGVSKDKLFGVELLRNAEEGERRSEYVSKVLPLLHRFGNTVIKIENLPAKLTVHALNLMMGTYTLTCDQIVAIEIPNERGLLMNIRIVMQSDQPDLQKIVSKNKWRTSYDTVLAIKRTDLKELEAFLNENYGKIYKLETSDKLPTVNSIGYGKLIRIL